MIVLSHGSRMLQGGRFSAYFGARKINNLAETGRRISPQSQVAPVTFTIRGVPSRGLPSEAVLNVVVNE
jgi:hypothetical protein